MLRTIALQFVVNQNLKISFKRFQYLKLCDFGGIWSWSVILDVISWDVFYCPSCLNLEYIILLLTHFVAEWSTLIGRDCQDRALIGRELHRTEIFSWCFYASIKYPRNGVYIEYSCLQGWNNIFNNNIHLFSLPIIWGNSCL